ncbi:hypothetical protein [Sphingobacterium hungaricum]|uniref:hypothetical protein n=1 Tax=Sphingobacterium hungaricum TaxID=2082723 RepID=UPI0018C92A30|nr:hypothetical protein [Sphingobacterium hungaricum]
MLSVKLVYIVPIPGSTKLAHIQENLGAANYEFSAEELTKFNTDLEKITIAGARN